MKKNFGLTFVEMMVVMVGLSILFGVAFSTFLIASKAIQKHQERIPGGEELSQGLQKAARELREGYHGTITLYNTIAHTVRYRDLDDGQHYVLYLYHPSDPFDSTYDSQLLYELRLARVAGFSYGSGGVLARHLMSPAAPQIADQAAIEILNPGTEDIQIRLIFTAAEITQAVSQKSEKVKMRLLIRPRNQG